MPRFMIEISHDDEHAACSRALAAIERQGSHFVTKADWGCKAGVHAGWLIVEVDTADDARRLLPPEYREEARVVQLNSFTKDDINDLLSELEGGA